MYTDMYTDSVSQSAAVDQLRAYAESQFASDYAQRQRVTFADALKSCRERRKAAIMKARKAIGE